MNKRLIIILFICCSTSIFAQQKKPQPAVQGKPKPQPTAQAKPKPQPAVPTVASLTAKLEAEQQLNRKLKADLVMVTATLTRLRRENETLASNNKPTVTTVQRPTPVNMQRIKDSIRAALIRSGEIRTVTVQAPASTAAKPVAAAPTLSPSPAMSSARLDACIQKNRQLATEIAGFSSKFEKLETETNTAKYYAEQYKKQIVAVRDSVKFAQKALISYQQQIREENQAAQDSLSILKQFKDDVMNEKQRTVNDTNIVRVYDLPVDVVRIKVLRKVLDETSGLILEKNMDDGFTVSRLYRDRYTDGVFRKVMSTKVDCVIKMLPHPLDSEKTIFYATTKLQERKQDKLPFGDQADAKLTKDYQNKLLSYFDTFLVK